MINSFTEPKQLPESGPWPFTQEVQSKTSLYVAALIATVKNDE